jgi:hypothetical protein
MSTLAEIEQQLPNGFHDAEIRSCTKKDSVIVAREQAVRRHRPTWHRS